MRLALILGITLTFDFQISNIRFRTEVENDVILKNIPHAVLAVSSKSSYVLRDIPLTSTVKYFDTPFLIEYIKVDSSVPGVRIFRKNRQVSKLAAKTAYISSCNAASGISRFERESVDRACRTDGLNL